MNLENKLYSALINVVDGLATFLMLLILIRSLMTWLKEDVLVKYYKIFRVVSGIIDPLMNFTAKMLPVRIGRMDFTPVVALLLVEAVKYIILFALKLIFGA
jgi:uncharacterized protein YggT (Ycf19 family)